MAVEDHQLVAKHHDLDNAVQIVGGVGEQSDETAQQEIHESEEHGPDLHEMKVRSYESCPRQRSAVCVPFRLSLLTDRDREATDLSYDFDFTKRPHPR